MMKKKKMAIFIEPEKLANHGLFERARGNEIFEIGYESAVEVLEKALGEGREVRSE